MKLCLGCHAPLPLDAFSPNSKGREGRAARCRVCEAAAARLRRSIKREALPKAVKASVPTSEYLRAWREENQDKVKAYAQTAKAKRQQAKLVATAYDVPIPKCLRDELRKSASKAYQAEWAQANRDRMRDADRRHYYKDIEASRARCREVAARVRAARPDAMSRRAQAHKYQRAWRKLPWVQWGDLFELRQRARRLTRETGVPHEVDHIYPLMSDVVCGLDVPANMRVVPRSVNRSKGNKLLLSLVGEHGVTDVRRLYADA